MRVAGRDSLYKWFPKSSVKELCDDYHCQEIPWCPCPIFSENTTTSSNRSHGIQCAIFMTSIHPSQASIYIIFADF